MEPLTQIVARHEFARKAAISRELEERLRDDKRLKDKRERERVDAFRDDTAIAMVFEVLATEAQVTEFRLKLDRHDAATVEALMLNERDLKIVREHMERIMLEAHVLPDGRRVFKTRDGSKVFDEHGAEIKPEELRPEEIDDRKPRWEDLLETAAKQAELLAERDELHAYQNKLDAARERLDDPKLTRDELDALDKELGEAAPQRVKALLGQDSDAPEQQREQGIGAELRPEPRATAASLAPTAP